MVRIAAIALLASAVAVAGPTGQKGTNKKPKHLQGRVERLLRSFGVADPAYNVHSDGKLATYYTDAGLIGFERPTIEFPTNSQRNYGWQMGIIIGAMVDTTADGEDNPVPLVSDTYEDYGEKNFSPIPGYRSGDFVAMSDDETSWPSAWPAGTQIGPESGWPGLPLENNEPVGTQESFWVMQDYTDDLYDKWGEPMKSVGALEVVARGIQINTTLTNKIIYFSYDIINKDPSNTLEGCRFGILLDPDHPAHVGLEYEDDNAEFDSTLDLSMSYDYDNSYGEWPGIEIAYVGTQFVKTPVDAQGNELGLTAWNCFTYADMPISGSVGGTDYASQDEAQYAYMEPGLFSPSPLLNRDIVYVASTGDFSIAPLDTQRVVFALMASDTREELIATAKAATRVFTEDFRAPSAPGKPVVGAVAGDGKVTLYWNAEPTESSVDRFTGKADFEGYRIYRSTNRGATWGETTDDLATYPLGVVPLADYNKVTTLEEISFVETAHTVSASAATITPVGVVPNTYDLTNGSYLITFLDAGTIQAFDVKNNVPLTYSLEMVGGFSILDSADWDSAPVISTEAAPGDLTAPYAVGQLVYLGGAVVEIDCGGEVDCPAAGDAFVVTTRVVEAGSDEGLRHSWVDEDVHNGVEYWYAVTAYDRADAENGIPANETPPATEPNTSAGSHTVSAIPNAPISNLTAGGVTEEGVVQTGGVGTGSVTVDVFDPALVKDGNFSIDLDVAEDGSGTYDLLSGTTVILNDQPVIESGDVSSPDAVPVHEGFRVTVTNQSSDWSDIVPVTLDEAHANWDDYWEYYIIWDYVENVPYRDVAIRFENSDYTSSGSDVPFSVWDISVQNVAEYRLHSQFDDANGNGTWTPDERIVVLDVPFSDPFPIGDVEAEHMEFACTFYDVTYNFCADTLCGFLADQWAGDEWQFLTTRAFTSNDAFSFQTAANEFSDDLKGALKQVKVVPNPFLVAASWDDQKGEHRVQFTHLPEAEDITIKIYTVAGDLVRSIDHPGGSGSYAWWDLKTESDMDVAFGVYLYHIEATSGGTTSETTGKIMVVR